MKCFSRLSLVLMIALIAAACGAQATPPPTVDPVDLQNTMAVAAFTMIAETQAAIPTPTPPPPTATLTNTPPPTETFLPPPGGTLTPVPGGNSGAGDQCIHAVLPATLVGVPVKVRVNNSTKVAVNFSIYLQQTTPNSVCGYRAYTIASQQSLVLNDLVQGCYTLWAWNPDPDEYFMVTNGTTCVDTSGTWVFDISTGSIKLK